MSESIKPKYPIISYNHILSELSVNSQDPCEVIRELISNSYDAEASQIQIYPITTEREKGFIFFDDGIGLNETEETNGITPYRAFFSIGKSTKVQGEIKPFGNIRKIQNLEGGIIKKIYVFCILI